MWIVVTYITEGNSYDKYGRPFRRRNYLPGIMTIAALLVITTALWALAITRPQTLAQTPACNPPLPTDSDTPSLGQPVPPEKMAEITPAALTNVPLQVLNASGRGGQAGTIAETLHDLGFTQPTAANDPLYAGTRLTCQGHIRFGPQGLAQAATVWLIAPCAELYQDNRTDNSVDLALGTAFTTIASSNDIDTVLASLRSNPPAPVDPALVSTIHNRTC